MLAADGVENDRHGYLLPQVDACPNWAAFSAVRGP